MIDNQFQEIEVLTRNKIIHVTNMTCSPTKKYILITTNHGFILANPSNNYYQRFISIHHRFQNKQSPFYRNQSTPYGAALGSVLETRMEVALVPNFISKKYNPTSVYIYDYAIETILSSFDFILPITSFSLTDRHLVSSNNKRLLIYNYTFKPITDSEQQYLSLFNSKQQNNNLRYLQMNCHLSQHPFNQCRCGQYTLSNNTSFLYIFYLKITILNNKQTNHIYQYMETTDSSQLYASFDSHNELVFRVSSDHKYFMVCEGTKVRVYNLLQKSLQTVVYLGYHPRPVLNMGIFSTTKVQYVYLLNNGYQYLVIMFSNIKQHSICLRLIKVHQHNQLLVIIRDIYLIISRYQDRSKYLQIRWHCNILILDRRCIVLLVMENMLRSLIQIELAYINLEILTIIIGLIKSIEKMISETNSISQSLVLYIKYKSIQANILQFYYHFTIPFLFLLYFLFICVAIRHSIVCNCLDYKMSQQIPASSYSTIFHCSQGLYVCGLRLLQGLLSLFQFWLFWRGYQAIRKQRNNKLSTQDKLLYQLAMWQTLMLGIYYLLFEEFFMLASIRNFLIWISINVLHIFSLLYWEHDSAHHYIARTMNVLQIVNIVLWLFISLGQGSSIENADYILGYNCQVPDWMIMSGILLAINICSSMLGYFKLNQIDWELQQLKADELSNSRKIAAGQQERNNLVLIMGSGLLGSVVMFGWDFLAFNKATDQNSCSALFSGDTAFRSLLTFILKIITMQLNPATIYYIMYFCRRDEFEEAGNEKRLNEELIDYFDDGASDLNRTLGSVRGSNIDRQGSQQRYISRYE